MQSIVDDKRRAAAVRRGVIASVEKAIRDLDKLNETYGDFDDAVKSCFLGTALRVRGRRTSPDPPTLT
jgi:hypothetical protein